MLKNELKNIKSKVYDSSTLFLQLSGIPLSKGGYVVVDDIYNTPEEDYSIVVKTLPKSNIQTLARSLKLNWLISGKTLLIQL